MNWFSDFLERSADRRDTTPGKLAAIWHVPESSMRNWTREINPSYPGEDDVAQMMRHFSTVELHDYLVAKAAAAGRHVRVDMVDGSAVSRSPELMAVDAVRQICGLMETLRTAMADRRIDDAERRVLAEQVVPIVQILNTLGDLPVGRVA